MERAPSGELPVGAARRRREPSALERLLPMGRCPGAGRRRSPTEMAADGVDAVREVVELDHVDLIWCGRWALEERLHDRQAWDEKTHRQLELRFLDLSRLEVPVEERLVGDLLGAAQGDDLAEKLRPPARLLDPEGGV